MADKQQLDILRQGARAWNQWRTDNPDLEIDLRSSDLLDANLADADLADANLSEADLSRANLIGADLSRANLIGADLSRANLIGADLSGADLNRAGLRGADLSKAKLIGANLSGALLSGANLDGADLSKAKLIGALLEGATLVWAWLLEANLFKARLREADLQWARLREAYLLGATLKGANLSRADLSKADLSKADLSKADLSNAYLAAADLSGAVLSGVNVTEAVMSSTVLGDVDLSNAKGLDTVRHLGPSTIGIDTIYRSQGKIPEAFLRGAGVPDNFITYMGSLTGKAFEFYSCFISYSTKDQEFAERLHADLQSKGVRCWFAPEDVQGGKKLHEQLFDAIRLHDKLLLVLSPNSLQSEWVMTEIRRTRRLEVEEQRRRLFPIRLVDYNALKQWECFDADTGKDLAIEVREYFMPDFSSWKDHDAYSKAFDRLLRDLKQSEKIGAI